MFLINISNFKILVFTQKAWCSKLIKKEKKTLRQLLCQLMVSLAKILSGNEYFAEKQGLKEKCKILRRVYQPKTLPAYIPESKKGFYLALTLIFILHVDSKFCWRFGILPSSIEICFFTSLSPESTKLVHFSSMYNNKDEKVKLLGCLFSSGFVPFQRE